MRPLWRDPSLLLFVLIAGCVWLLCSVAGCPSASASLADCIEATCRIESPDGGRGTGCAFERANGRVYVLTNAHVVDKKTDVTCVFWRDGHESLPIAGQVIARAAGEVDAVVIAIAESSFGRFPPRIIPLAKRGYELRAGQTITSVGCAKGAWSTAWKGHAVGPANFVPPPLEGRSGSALFDAQGERIVGLIWGRRDDEGRGYAVTVAELYQGFSAWANGKTTRTSDNGAWRAVAKTATPPTCGPDGCGPEGCQVLPWRFYNNQRLGQLQQQPQQPPIQIYPTLPYSQPAPAPAANLDLSEVNARLDRIATLLESFPAMLAAGGSRALPVQPQSNQYQPQIEPFVAASPRLEAVVADAKAQQADTARAVAAVETTQSKLLGAVNQLVGDRETLLERFNERLDRVRGEQGEDATTRQLAEAYVRDLGAEKAGDVGSLSGSLLGGLLGMGGLVSAGLAAAGGLAGRHLGKRIKGKDE